MFKMTESCVYNAKDIISDAAAQVPPVGIHYYHYISKLIPFIPPQILTVL